MKSIMKILHLPLFFLAISFLGCKKKTEKNNQESDIPKGFSVYMPFDGKSQDNSGNNLTTQIIGGVTTSKDRHNKQDGALHFNGVDGYVSIKHNDIFNGDGFTFSAWVKPTNYGTYSNSATSSSAYSGLFNKYNESLNKGITNSANSIGIRVTSFFANGKYVDGSGSLLTLNEWQHIAITVSMGILRIYKNGTEVAFVSNPTTASIYSDNSPLEIGRTKWFPSNLLMLSYFTGDMDDVYVYYRALTKDEIAKLAI